MATNLNILPIVCMVPIPDSLSLVPMTLNLDILPIAPNLNIIPMVPLASILISYLGSQWHQILIPTNGMHDTKS